MEWLLRGNRVEVFLPCHGNPPVNRAKPVGENLDTLETPMNRGNAFGNVQKRVGLFVVYNLLEFFLHLDSLLRVELAPVSL